jgi:tetratricopeptide (TPR) repeat protein
MFLAKNRCPACFTQWGRTSFCPACGGAAEIFFEKDLPKPQQIDRDRVQSMIDVARVRVYGHPNDGNARYMLGLNYVFLGLIEEGISEIEIAADILPEKVQIRYEAAALSVKQGNSSDLILTEVNAILEKKPEYKEAHYLKGIIHENRGELEQAVRAWQAAYQIDPSYEPAETKLWDFVSRERDYISLDSVTDPDSDLRLPNETLENLRIICSAEPVSPPELGTTSMRLLGRLLPRAAAKVQDMYQDKVNSYTRMLALRANTWRQLESDLIVMSSICLASHSARERGATKESGSEPATAPIK